MGSIDDPLWQALSTMRIEPEGAALTFTRRLARENGWSGTHAAAVVLEYKRFLYLAAHSADPVTPSEQVDQAWHLHLAYTRHYWGELCARIIGRPLHHGPTAGGSAEGRKFRTLYAETLARYHDTFGCPPPAAIWPPTEQRFATNYQWVDRSQNIVLPRRSVSIAALAGGAALLAACTALAADQVAADGTPTTVSFFRGVLASDLGFFVGILLLFAVLIVIVNAVGLWRGKGSARQQPRSRRNARRRQRDSSSGSDSPSDGWSAEGIGSAAAGAGAVGFAAGGGDFGGGGAEGDWDSGGDAGSPDSGGDSSGGDSGCSGCGGGCGGGGD